MKKWLVLLLLPLAACSCEDDNLKEVCPLPVECYIRDGQVVERDEDNPYRLNLEFPSTCRLGMTKCDPKTFEITCEGYQPPTDELCDGLDNDCDTVVDEGTTITYGDINNDCDGLGICKYSDKRCVAGHYECVPIYQNWYGDEVCDGYDNDCDGEIDEDTPEEPLFDDRWVYEGPWETEGIGQCKAGRKRCSEGAEILVGMTLPEEEDCSDNIDNDCDGLVDEIDDPEYEGAFALVLDVSGSMGFTLDLVWQAVCNWSNEGILGDSYFAVVFTGIMFPDFSVVPDQILFGMDFGTSQQLCDYLGAKPWLLSGQGGTEFQPNAAMQTHQSEYFLNSDGTIDQAMNLIPAPFVDGGMDPDAGLTTSWEYVEGQLNWPEGLDKKVVIFTDERIQYKGLMASDPIVGSQQEQEFIEDCQQNDYEVGVFTPNWHQYEWQNPVDECGGFIDGLYYYTQQEMEERLLHNFTGGC